MVYADDIGSFPLPKEIKKEEFSKIYFRNYDKILRGEEPDEIFKKSIFTSLKYKIKAGLDYVTYPQHFDMHKQFLEPILKYQSEPYLIDEKKAIIPEVKVVEEFSKEYYEETGEPLKLRVCVTGAVELYLRTEFGTYVYPEVLMNIAESVNRFLKNSLVDKKYIKAEVFSIDEPSLGLADIMNLDEETLIKALDKSVESVKDKHVQIHLHSLKMAESVVKCDNIKILTGEFASTPINAELIKKEDLERYDKFLRAGITRTNIDTIIGELVEKGVKYTEYDLIDDKETIKKRFKWLLEKFGNRILFAGPDCGLGSWPSQEVAYELLRRTVEAVRETGREG